MVSFAMTVEDSEIYTATSEFIQENPGSLGLYLVFSSFVTLLFPHQQGILSSKKYTHSVVPDS